MEAIAEELYDDPMLHTQKSQCIPLTVKGSISNFIPGLLASVYHQGDVAADKNLHKLFSHEQTSLQGTRLFTLFT